MTTVDRSELTEVLSELSRQYPHWRYGQLLSNVAGWADVDLWDAEDEQLLAAAQAHLASIRRRSEAGLDRLQE